MPKSLRKSTVELARAGDVYRDSNLAHSSHSALLSSIHQWAIVASRIAYCRSLWSSCRLLSDDALTSSFRASSPYNKEDAFLSCICVLLGSGPVVVCHNSCTWHCHWSREYSS